MGLQGGGAIGDHYTPGFIGRRKVTPAAGAHTYSVRAHASVVACEVGGGPGTTGDYEPAYIRITKA